MQRFKNKYQDKNHKDTFSNVQKCLRLNDLKEIGDSTHYLIFNMLGLFSFRDLSLQETINFWLLFTKEINNYPDYITIHPDKKEWVNLYPKDMEIRFDDECIWSDGVIGGYCTEFYKNDVEIGNIVNTLGDCIDVGFGCERLLVNMISSDKPSKSEILKDTIEVLINSNITLSNNKQGYILKKLLVDFVLSGGNMNNKEFEIVKKNQINVYENYKKMKLKNKYKNKDSYWWLDTIGIDENKINLYEKLEF